MQRNEQCNNSTVAAQSVASCTSPFNMLTTIYEKLPRSERASDDMSEESSEHLLSHPERPRSRPSPVRQGLLYASLLLVGLILGALGTKLAEWALARPSRLSDLAIPSPVTHDLAIEYHQQTFEGSFLNENVFRRPGSPEVDEAWAGLGVDYRAMVVPAELAEAAGVPKDRVQVNEKYGGGYPANLEGLHHLHCLNLVRQALYYNIDYYRAQKKGAFENNDHIVQKHVSHCLDIVRQQLMCTVDTGVLGQLWWKSPKDPFPSAFVDFNTQHVCKNFEAIRDWAKERQMPDADDLPDDWLAMPSPDADLPDHIP